MFHLENLLYTGVAYRNPLKRNVTKMYKNDRHIDNFFGEYERPVRWGNKQNNIGYGRNFAMRVQKDCFGYHMGRCRIMTELICKRNDCSFYKSKEQDRKDREIYGYVKDYKPKEDDQ